MGISLKKHIFDNSTNKQKWFKLYSTLIKTIKQL